ncbi:tetratricopeptide repeat protein [Chloroflexia bacterium SDU3-3]|nr:tetratricopeptide repeat protein [Chloroflexia bacterium SDU3-3]
MRRTFSFGRYWGVDLQIHWLLPLFLVYIVWINRPSDMRGVGYALLGGVLLLLSVLLHEVGHAVVARVCGFRTRSIVLWPLGGFANIEMGGAARWQRAVILLAGPAANAALGLICGGAWLAARTALRAPVELTAMLSYATMANGVLCVFNMLPAYPLDGGQIAWLLLDRLLGQPWAARVMIGISAALAALIVGASVALGDPLMGVVALFIVAGSISLNPQASAWMTRQIGLRADPGYRFIERKEYQRAVDHYSRTIPRKASNANYHNNRGYAYLCLGDPAQAIPDFSRAIALSPGAALIYMNRGNAYLALHQPELALADFHRAAELEPSNVFAFAQAAHGYIAQGDFDRALEQADRAMAVAPGHVAGPLARALVYMHRSPVGHADHQLAIAENTRMIALAPAEDTGYNNRGYVRFLNGDLAGAEADYQLAFARLPDSMHLLSGKAELLAARGDAEGALAEYQRLAALDPKHMFNHRELAALSFQRGDQRRAAEHAALALAADARGVLAPSPCVMSYYVRGRLDFQLFVCRCAQDQQVDPALVHLGRAEAHRANGQPEQSVEHYRAALVARPSWEAALFGRGMAYAAMGRASEARFDLVAVAERGGNRFLQRLAREQLAAQSSILQPS